MCWPCSVGADSQCRRSWPPRSLLCHRELNFSVADKDACIAGLKAAFADAELAQPDGVTLRYADWWCNVRPSNTEPVLRLNLEAKTPALRDEMLLRASKPFARASRTGSLASVLGRSALPDGERGGDADYLAGDAKAMNRSSS